MSWVAPFAPLPEDVLGIVVDFCSGSLHWRLHCLSLVSKRFRRLVLQRVASLPLADGYATWANLENALTILPSLTSLDIWITPSPHLKAWSLPPSLRTLRIHDWDTTVKHPCALLQHFLSHTSLTALRYHSSEYKCPCVAQRLALKPPPLLESLYLDCATKFFVALGTNALLPRLQKLHMELNARPLMQVVLDFVHNHAMQLTSLKIADTSPPHTMHLIGTYPLPDLQRARLPPSVLPTAEVFPSLTDLELLGVPFRQEAVPNSPWLQQTLTRVGWPPYVLDLDTCSRLTAIVGLALGDMSALAETPLRTSLMRLSVRTVYGQVQKTIPELPAITFIAPFTNLTDLSLTQPNDGDPRFSMPFTVRLPSLRRIRYTKIIFNSFEECNVYWRSYLLGCPRLERVYLHMCRLPRTLPPAPEVIALFAACEAAGVQRVDVWSKSNRPLIKCIASKLQRMELRCLD